MSSRGGGTLIRCDGSRQLGMGHVYRCLSIAQALRAAGERVCFAVREGEAAVRTIEAEGFPLFRAHAGAAGPVGTERWLVQLVKAHGIRSVVLDVRDPVDWEGGQALAELCFLVTIDDSSERRLWCDLAFYPPVPQVDRLEWEGFSGERWVGFEWVPLRAQFRWAPPAASRSGDRPTVLVSLGGSDPVGITPLVVAALEGVRIPLQAVVVVGPANPDRERIESAVAESVHRYEIVCAVSDMAALMAGADLAVLMYGMTAWEAAAMGLPALYLYLSPDHRESASALERAGCAWGVGMCDEVTASALTKALEVRLEDPGALESARGRARSCLDARGAERIARKILQGAYGG